MRPPIKLPELSPEAIAELDQLYRTTGDVRLRMRAQIVLLAAEQRMLAPEIARIVRSDEQTVRTWLKRYMAEGVAGLADAPRPDVKPKVTRHTVRSCSRLYVSVHAVWANLTRCGPCSVWPITWRNRLVSGSATLRCVLT